MSNRIYKITDKTRATMKKSSRIVEAARLVAIAACTLGGVLAVAVVS